MHGFGIIRRIRQASREVFIVNAGSLYPALHRLQERGWIDSEWATTENNRRAKMYRLTRAGRRQLQQEAKQWEVLSAAIRHVLQSA